MQALHDRFARVALVVYLLLVGLVVFQSEPQLAVGSVVHLDAWLVRLGAPESLVNEYRVEFLLNTVLFMPLAFLGMQVWPRVRWSEWVVVAFAGSVGIEMAQALFLDARSAQFADVVSNTLGGLLGAVVGLAWRSWWGMSGARRQVA